MKNNDVFSIKLTSQERKAMKCTQTRFFHIEKMSITTEVIADHLSISVNEAAYMVSHLINLGLLSDGKVLDGLHITPKGHQYLSAIHTQLVSKLIWNVVVPIIVAYITAKITMM